MEKHPQNSANPTTPTNASTESKSFTPPRHWLGTKELEASYWADPAVQEKRSQEFYDKPVEAIDKIDRTDTAGLARRDFLTIMGASMAMASFACARRPVHKIIPYVVKPEEITPGNANWYASTCKDTGCGILIKNREGRPIKVEGNPDHPMNAGTLSARGQASVLSLYDPDRLKAPVAGLRSGARADIAWADADAKIVAKLKTARNVRILSGDVNSESTNRLIKEFLSVFPNGAQVTYEPLAVEEISEGQNLSYGAALVPHYRFDEAEMVVSLGADFLGTWLSPVEYARMWSKNRKLDSKNAHAAKLSKLVTFESTMTITGANSDERIPVRPGDEYKVALALAHEIIVAQKRSGLAGDAAVTAVLAGYTPEAVAAELELDGGANRIKKIAHEMIAAAGKGLVVGGGLHSKTAQSVALQVAVNLLNSALGNEGVTVDGTVRVATQKSRFAEYAKLIQEMKAGQVDVLVLYRTNPSFTSPRNVLGLEDAMKKVPLVISVGDHEDETAQLTDFALADHHFLENWGDANPYKGLYSLQQPAMAPMHNTRAFEDTLLAWGKAMGKAPGLMAQAADWHAYLMANWKQLYAQYKVAGTFEQFWESSLRLGVFDTRAASGAFGVKPSARSFRSASVSALPKYSRAANEGVKLALYETVNIGDGRFANNAWLQELPDPISSVVWDNYLNISPALAKKLGFQGDSPEGVDVIEVTAGDVKFEVPVHVQPGMHPQAVSVAVGYGRRAAGKVGTGAGVDVFPVGRVENGMLVYSGSEVKLRKTGKSYRLAMTQWHTATENRPVINDITFAEFKANPGTANHTDPHLRVDTPSMWPTHEYKGYRWGMAIDLNSCTGCGACMIGCQAENNIPVVGRDQVRVSRQMHWIRIDRYYSGSPDNPDVVFQPMLCQHCENASCETVCPVLATVHDDEGLNVQVYNRCVGTRYCQNNCPYKVRRFNFFDHWKSYEGTMNLVWNPDVTVRTRGIMEKCTFCVQRIRDAKDKAKDAGVKVADGAFKTACQQTCPTDAIVFGDVNDANSRVSKLRAEQRAFRVIEEVNNKPMISYLTKVRNKEGGAAHHGEHHV